MKKLVGLVLNDPIAFSETFFFNDIEILKRAGFVVIVFTGYSKKKKKHLPM